MKRKYLFLIIPILALALFAALVPFEAERGEIAVTTAADGTLLPSDELDDTVLDFLNEAIQQKATNAFGSFTAGSTLYWVRYQTLLGLQKATYFALPCANLNVIDPGVGSSDWSTKFNLIAIQVKNGQLQSAENKVKFAGGNASMEVAGNIVFYSDECELTSETDRLDGTSAGQQASCSFQKLSGHDLGLHVIVAARDNDVPAGSTVTVNASWNTKAKIGSSKIDCGETTVSYIYQTANNS